MKKNRRRMKKSAVVFLSFLISILLVSSAPAAWVELTDLVPISSLPGGQLEVGDKLFSEFEVTGIADGGPPEPSADLVKVQGGQNSETGDYGLRFRLAWNAGSNQLIDAGINFKVSILEGYDPWLIEDAILWLPVAGATDAGLVSVTEIIYDAPFTGVSLAQLDCKREMGDGGVNLIDSSDLLDSGGSPVQVKEIWIRTDIIVRGGYSPNPGTANLTEVFMLYSQIPEPATVLLLGLGALALVRIRKL